MPTAQRPVPPWTLNHPTSRGGATLSNPPSTQQRDLETPPQHCRGQSPPSPPHTPTSPVHPSYRQPSPLRLAWTPAPTLLPVPDGTAGRGATTAIRTAGCRGAEVSRRVARQGKTRRTPWGERERLCVCFPCLFGGSRSRARASPPLAPPSSPLSQQWFIVPASPAGVAAGSPSGTARRSPPLARGGGVAGDGMASGGSRAPAARGDTAAAPPGSACWDFMGCAWGYSDLRDPAPLPEAGCARLGCYLHPSQDRAWHRPVAPLTPPPEPASPGRGWHGDSVWQTGGFDPERGRNKVTV